MKLNSYLPEWSKRCESVCFEHNLLTNDINTGQDAWTVAHKAGIVMEAYKLVGVHDAHIQTALRSIFPNAVFKDKLHY